MLKVANESKVIFFFSPTFLQNFFRVLWPIHWRRTVIVQLSIAHRLCLGFNRTLAADGWYILPSY